MTELLVLAEIVRPQLMLPRGDLMIEWTDGVWKEDAPLTGLQQLGLFPRLSAQQCGQCRWSASNTQAVPAAFIPVRSHQPEAVA